ncbi:MAG: hypothetical protein ACRC1D_01895 [Culicoidibacterales bacterium]
MVTQWMPPRLKEKPKKLIKQEISTSNAAQSTGMSEEEFRAQIQAKRDAEEEARREKVRKQREEEKSRKKLEAKMKDAARKRNQAKKIKFTFFI